MIKIITKLHIVSVLAVGLWLAHTVPLECMMLEQAGRHPNDVLVQAADEGNLTAVKDALSAGADVNCTDMGGWTACMFAARHAEVVRILIEHSANVNQADRHGDTALILAALWGHTEIARMLIEAGADINHTNNNGDTALWLAADYGKTETVRLLIEHGAKLPSISQPIQKIRGILRKLIDNDSIVEVILGNTKSIGELVDQAPQAYNTDQASKTALHWAVAQGNDAIVRLLLNHDFDIDAQDEDGNTPLHVAACNDNLSTVKLLVACGAQGTLVNRYGGSPLTLARQYHRSAIVDLLQREAGIAVFGRLSRAGRAGGFAWQSTPTCELLPPDVARQIAQYALAPGYIPQTGSPS